MNRSLAVVLCSVVVGACAMVDVSAPARTPRATVALTISGGAAGGTVELEGWYRTRSGTRAVLGTTTASLAGGTVAVPVTLDIGTCLASAAAVPGVTGCPVRVDVLLFGPSGAIADSIALGPFDARAGAVVSVPAASGPTLRFVDSIAWQRIPSTLGVGDTASASVTLRDRTGTVLPSRALLWRSSAPTVAVVSSDGLLRAVGDGVTTISAIAAEDTTRRATQTVTVTSGPPPVFASVSAGATHTCAVRPTGEAYCWGSNALGALGDSTTVLQSLLPSAVRTTLRFREVATGGGFACGLTTTDAVWCWGDNRQGQLGNRTTTSASVPVAVAGARTFTRLSAGFAHVCGLATDGAIYCWGDNASGQLGDSTTSDRLEPTLVRGGRSYSAVAVGEAHSCAIERSTAVFCWGNGANGRLGDGQTSGRTTPVLVTVVAGARQIAAGGAHTCAVLLSNAGACWGSSGGGRLGGGIPVVGGLSFSAIAASDIFSCGLDLSGAAWCWGNSLNLGAGNLGMGSTSTPTAVSGNRTFVSLVVSRGGTGGHRACAISRDGRTYCWGFNTTGEFGNGTTGDNGYLPAAVTSP